MKPRILFYCQHVLGMGHMVRSREIVKGLGEFDVCFVNGGEPVDGFAFPAGVRVVQLPPIRSDSAFLAIDATEAVKAERCRILLELLETVDPSIAVIEMFPFGRRKFAFELVPFLEEIRRRGSRTRVVSSVRDILVGKRDQARHEERACRLLNEYFDLVLVHADPRFQQLGETFLRAADIRCPVQYTGFVIEPMATSPPSRQVGGRKRIVASAGGGRVGFSLLAAAIAASHHLSARLTHELAVFTGPYLPDDEFDRLTALIGPCSVDPARTVRGRFRKSGRRSRLVDQHGRLQHLHEHSHHWRESPGATVHRQPERRANDPSSQAGAIGVPRSPE